MKKYLVIGNPIAHSLSPKLHNYWLVKNKINGIYDKERLNESDLETLVSKIRKKEINGANITIPFKRKVINHLDKLSSDAQSTQSVNTIHFENNQIVGHNTDIAGFVKAIRNTGYDVVQKRILILGAGGVVPSIIFALYKMKVFNITLSNRSIEKALYLKNLFNDLKIVKWGQTPDTDMVINATSVGLSENDKLDLNFSKFQNSEFFYDVIYNPKETNFLKSAKKLGKQTENGKKMFIYQAAEAFKIWHGIDPEINKEIEGLLDD